MELKQAGRRAAESSSSLLIVPYGIETIEYNRLFQRMFLLLIVPYGIETQCSNSSGHPAYYLLIVPYGIETLNVRHSRTLVMLLIVPYGIETCISLQIPINV